MKIFHLSFFDVQNVDKPTEMSQTSCLSLFALGHKAKINEILRFISSTIVGKVNKEVDSPFENTSTSKISIADHGFTIHVLLDRSIKITGALITDNEYPAEVAYRVIKGFLSSSSSENCRRSVVEACLKDKQLISTTLQEFQNPSVDKIYKIKQDIEENKIILHRVIEQVMERGEKLDDLIEKTNFLSENSKSFYKQSKRQAQFCPWWFPFF